MSIFSGLMNQNFPFLYNLLLFQIISTFDTVCNRHTFVFTCADPQVCYSFVMVEMVDLLCLLKI